MKIRKLRDVFARETPLRQITNPALAVIDNRINEGATKVVAPHSLASNPPAPIALAQPLSLERPDRFRAFGINE